MFAPSDGLLVKFYKYSCGKLIASFRFIRFLPSLVLLNYKQTFLDIMYILKVCNYIGDSFYKHNFKIPSI